jgi:hypothetical protein
MQTRSHLPEPSEKHATCAWCRQAFETIVQLIDHVDGGHLLPATHASSVRHAA